MLQTRFGLILLTSLLISGLLSLFSEPAAAQSEATWRDTGLVLEKFPQDATLCIDNSQPNTLVVGLSTYSAAEYSDTVYAYNWLTKQKLTLNNKRFNQCSKTGWYYTPDGTRFSVAAPAPQKLAYPVTHSAKDGSLSVYSLTRAATGPGTQDKTTLRVSLDGGLTWQERGQQFSGRIYDLAVSPVDASSLYAAVMVGENTSFNIKYELYFSADTGVSWEKRSEGALSGCIPTIDVNFLDGYAVPVTQPYITTSAGCPSAGGVPHRSISWDGGRTFTPLGGLSLSSYTSEVSTSYGVARLTGYSYNSAPELDFLETGSKEWRKLDLPKPVFLESLDEKARFELNVLPNAPTSLILAQWATNKSGRKFYPRLWISRNAGDSWETLPGLDMERYIIGTYAPFSLLGLKDGKVSVLDLAYIHINQALPEKANNIPTGNYYPETKHNLSGVFKQYWEQHGGLAQFGYPRTDPFVEYNPSDGKLYTVQYFERNRFEYHPEKQGTKYEVLLGLLGNQLTEKQRQQGHGAFNRFDDQKYSGGLYFPETGHNLRNSFKEYWEANGGLAIYGYPISEEFEEVNPDDGKTYVVQYFERNRFEYHPENKGTKYEVLLGLLGNSLLKQKNWLFF